MPSHTSCQILRNQQGASEAVSDEVAVEEPLEIWAKHVTQEGEVVKQRLLTTMRTPGDDLALATGWLLTSAAINHSDIANVQHTGITDRPDEFSNRVLITMQGGVSLDTAELQRVEYVNSACGVCGQQNIEELLERLPVTPVSGRISLPSSSLHYLTQKLKDNQSLFATTGASHAVGLFDENAQLIDVAEDVGRHNAMDKIIGKHVARSDGKFGVVVSGRVGFEIVQKAATAGISMIVSVGAPTSLAVELCRECDIALIGFVKQDSFNIYHGERQLANY